MVRVKSKRRSLLGNVNNRRRRYGSRSSGGGRFPYASVILTSIVVLQIGTILWMQNKSSSSTSDVLPTSKHSVLRKTHRVSSTTTVTDTVDKKVKVGAEEGFVDDDVQRHVGVKKKPQDEQVIIRTLDDDDDTVTVDNNNQRQAQVQEEPKPKQPPPPPPPPPKPRPKPIDLSSIPEFRRNISTNYYDSLIQTVAKQLEKPSEQLRSCYALGPTIGTNSIYPKLLLRSECSSSQQDRTRINSWWAHNTLDFPRSFCGVLILPGETKELPTITKDGCYAGEDGPPVTYLSADLHVPLDGYGMPPIILELEQDENNEASSYEMVKQDCDIPCQATIETCEDGQLKGEQCLEPESTFYVLNNAGTRPKDGIIFEYDITYPDENDNSNNEDEQEHYKQLYQHRRYPVTYDFEQAAVPISTFSWSKYGGHSPPVDFEAMDKSIAFLGSEDCQRAKPFVEALNADDYFSVVAYGKCAHNTDLPESMGPNALQNERDRNHLYKEYIFALIVEPTTAKDYIGEDVWEALHAGVVPIYYGATNIQDHVPPNSIINIASFETTEKLLEHLKNVAEDKIGYDVYHQWRHGAFPPTLAKSFDFLRSNMYCRMCRFAYMKRYGLGWDHSEQIPLETASATHRSIQCISQYNGMMARPFVESWFSPGSGDEVKTTSSEHSCENNKETTSVHIGKSFSFIRRLSAHDGVFDFSIHDIKPKSGNSQHPLWFRLEGPGIENEKGVDFNNVHADDDILAIYKGLYTSLVIQDDKTRMTLIASWATDNARSPNPGIMEIEVVPTHTPILSGSSGGGGNERRTLRLIVEPVERESQKDIYQLSPFAKMHLQDFMEPLALFYKKPPNSHQIMEQ